MKILAIDFGLKKIGLAMGNDVTRLSEPLGVIKFNNLSQAIEKILKLPEISEVSQVLMGLSAGSMALHTKKFGDQLGAKLGIPILYIDETYSTKEAQTLSIHAGIKRSKRKSMEDAYAAAVILQNYLDSS